MSAIPLQLHNLRTAYHEHRSSVERALHTQLGDHVRLTEHRERLLLFWRHAQMHRHLFPTIEFAALEQSVAQLTQQLDQACQRSNDVPDAEGVDIVTVVRTGRPGRPRKEINVDFLKEMQHMGSNAAVAEVARCCPRTVRRRKLDHGLAAPAEPVFHHIYGVDGSHQSYYNTTRIRAQPTNITDSELDELILNSRILHPTVGRLYIIGELNLRDKWASTQRIRAALLRVNGAPNPFGRRDIPRQPYRVAGPNSLWHHDGQHGLIRWKIIIHGFCDGHTRLMAGIRASNNNRGATVLDVFLVAVEKYGVPSRLRGDHGVENILTAQWMEDNRGRDRGSYIWGLSIHNTRIERMWYDVTQKFGAKWARFFTELEVHYGLDVARSEHIWLLHHLFLPKINQDALHWANVWNHHPLSLPGERFKTPKAMWMVGMAKKQRGLRYTPQPQEDNANGDPAMYGIDWAAQGDEDLMRHHFQHHPHTVGEEENPFDLHAAERRYNEVKVEPPTCPLLPNQIVALDEYIASHVDVQSDVMEVRRQVWVVGLEAARVLWTAAQELAQH